MARRAQARCLQRRLTAAETTPPGPARPPRGQRRERTAPPTMTWAAPGRPAPGSDRSQATSRPRGRWS
eukprot:6833709-Lingulodinium_polyedra.AAC.1